MDILLLACMSFAIAFYAGHRVAKAERKVKQLERSIHNCLRCEFRRLDDLAKDSQEYIFTNARIEELYNILQKLHKESTPCA